MLTPGWSRSAKGRRTELRFLLIETGLEVNMDLVESKTHSFIVKIWLEETESTGRASWRGHIRHVSNGQPHYLESLSEITVFITPYLKEMGIKDEPRWRLWQWMARLRESRERN